MPLIRYPWLCDWIEVRRCGSWWVRSATRPEIRPVINVHFPSSVQTETILPTTTMVPVLGLVRTRASRKSRAPTCPASPMAPRSIPPGEAKTLLLASALADPRAARKAANAARICHTQRGMEEGGDGVGAEGVEGVRESAERAERSAGEEAAAKRASAAGVADTPASPVAAAPMA